MSEAEPDNAEASPEQSESENEENSINEDDLVEDNKDYNSESESDDDEKKIKKEVKPPPIKQVKKNDDDEEDEEDAEDDGEDDEYEIDQVVVQNALKITEKYGIVIDPRNLDYVSLPNPKIKKEIIVSPDNRKSSEYIQLYEYCEIIGIRAQHISEGATVYGTIEDETTARDLAKKELQMGLCPLLIKRYMTPMNYFPVSIEIWNPNEMTINPKFFEN